MMLEFPLEAHPIIAVLEYMRIKTITGNLLPFSNNGGYMYRTLTESKESVDDNSIMI